MGPLGTCFDTGAERGGFRDRETSDSPTPWPVQCDRWLWHGAGKGEAQAWLAVHSILSALKPGLGRGGSSAMYMSGLGVERSFLPETGLGQLQEG